MGEENLVSDAMECVKFRIVRDESDIENDQGKFEPLFCHQFFGENETIFGYSGLSVTLFSTFCDCQFYCKIKFDTKVATDSGDKVEADDIISLLKKRYPDHGFHTNLETFRHSLNEQHKNKPFGELIHAYHTSIENSKKEYQIYKIDSAAKNEKFIQFYERIEMFSFWYIDAASCIDTDDDKWTFYITYEKFTDSSQRTCYGFVGYSSVYNYYAYPEHLKPRIGHFLILPPFQKCGHGFHLLQTIYNDLIPNPRVLEISAEDPAEKFVLLRNFVNSTNCMNNLDAFKMLSKLKTDGFTKEMVQEARLKLKMGKTQIRRVYEILRLKATDASKAEEFKAYRLEVKQRLFKPFKKNRKDWKMLNKALTPEETAAAAASMTTENVHATLQSLFDQTMDDYRFVLNRLAAGHDVPQVSVAKMAPKLENATPQTNGHA